MRRRRLGFFLLALGFLLSLAVPAAALCPGDCDGAGTVTIDELTRAVVMALTGGSTAACASVDADDDGVVRINELVGAVQAALAGCPPSALALSAPVNVSNSPTLSQGASIARDGAGNITVVWEERGSDVLLSRSTDGGATFSTPVHVMDPDGPFGSANVFSSSQMRVASTSGAAHVVWTIFDLSGGGAEVFYVRADAGAEPAFLPPMISTDDGVNSYSPSLAADVADSVGIVWSDSDLTTGRAAIYYSGAMGSGAAVSAPLLLADSASCPSIALSSGLIYVAWTAGDFGQEQIFFARSTDSGNSFSVPIVVDHVPAKSWCPQIGVDARGSIYVLWEEGDAFHDRKILLARSVDQGVTFGSPVTLSDPTTDSTCPSLAIDAAGGLFVTWSLQAAITVGDSFLVVSTNGGDTFSPPLEIPPATQGAGCYALIADAPNQIGLAWHSEPVGGGDIFYRAGQVSPEP